MTPMTTPWHGILVATALPMRQDARGELQPDFDAYADHVRWLADERVPRRRPQRLARRVPDADAPRTAPAS